MTFDYTLKITDVLKNMGGKGGFLTVKSPVIDNCHMYYECGIVYKHPIDLEFLDEKIKNEWYQEDNNKWYEPGDCHTIYYGEILNCYSNE